MRSASSALTPCSSYCMDIGSCSQEGVQKPLGGLMGEQAAAKIVQQGEVEAWIGQFETQGVLPIHTAADGIGGLAVGEPLDVWHHHHENQAPRRHLHRAPGGRIQVGEELIILERAELGTQRHREVAFGEGSLYGSHRGLGDRW
jgi:hypothetical protein